MKKISFPVKFLLFLCFFGLLLFPANSKAASEPKASSSAGNVCYQPAQGKKYLINVSAATLWSKPGIHRPIDRPALENPVDLRKWTSSMKLKDKLGLGGKAETQALYGQKVILLKKQGVWAHVAVIGQGTPKHKQGYPGWIPLAQLKASSVNSAPCKTAIIHNKTAYLYADKKSPFLEVSFDTRLPVVKEEKEWIGVLTPSAEVKWVRRADVKLYEKLVHIPKPSGELVVQTGKRFLGLPYLWSGTSGFGFDCSGFTYTVYKHHGILLPRDASEQIKKGTPVSKNSMRPGDLLFFAYNKGKGKVHHVAMYAGGGKMIHSPNSGRNVEIISIQKEPYRSEFAGARRYIQ